MCLIRLCVLEVGRRYAGVGAGRDRSEPVLRSCAHKAKQRVQHPQPPFMFWHLAFGIWLLQVNSNNISGNTLYLFTGDNGPWMVKGKSGGSEGLLTGVTAGYWNTGKGSTWEGGMHEAGFAHWQGQIEPMSRSSEVVSSMDVFPTVSKLAGVPLPQDRVCVNQASLSRPFVHGEWRWMPWRGGCAQLVLPCHSPARSPPTPTPTPAVVGCGVQRVWSAGGAGGCGQNPGR